MKQIIILAFLFISFSVSAQIGLKAGLNFANVTGASQINNGSRTGFHAGIFLSPKSKSVLGSRTELIFSKQGYNYKSGENTGAVNLNYLMLPQYMTINITKYVQLQLGGQISYLLNASSDSATTTSSAQSAGLSEKMINYYNRIDYGYGGGVEIHPYKGLLFGAKINISLGDLYKDPTAAANMGSFIPTVNVKNNVFQIFAGWIF